MLLPLLPSKCVLATKTPANRGGALPHTFGSKRVLANYSAVLSHSKGNVGLVSEAQQRRCTEDADAAVPW